MQSSLAERFLEELEANKKLKIRLADIIASDPEVRLYIQNSILPDVARKEDIKELRAEMAQLRVEISQLRTDIAQLRKEMYSNSKMDNRHHTHNMGSNSNTHTTQVSRSNITYL